MQRGLCRPSSRVSCFPPFVFSSVVSSKEKRGSTVCVSTFLMGHLAQRGPGFHQWAPSGGQQLGRFGDQRSGKAREAGALADQAKQERQQAGWRRQQGGIASERRAQDGDRFGNAWRARIGDDEGLVDGTRVL